MKSTNTFARSKSALQTWSNGNTSSQIDHVLVPSGASIRIKEKSVKGCRPKMFKTDHKIILASVRSISYRSKVVHSGTAHKKWDVKLLANEKKRSEFSKSVLKRLEQTQFNTTDTGSFWGQLKEVLTGVAEEAIPPEKKAPMSPITRRAYAKLQGKINRQKRFPDVERCRTETVLARSEFEQAKKEHIWRTWRNFFTNLNCADPYMWLKKTFEFLKSQKRMKGAQYRSSNGWSHCTKR